MTDAQMAWCRFVVSGVSRVDAYRKAFNRNDMGNEAASKAAYRLSKNSEVLQYMDELRAAAAKQAVLSREERMQMLSRSAVKCENGEKFGEMTKMISELNRMDGAYAPEQVEVEAKVSVAGLVMALQDKGCRPGESGAGRAD